MLKWAAFNRLENPTFLACESVQEFRCMAQDVLADLIDLELTLEELITLEGARWLVSAMRGSGQ
jgi:hypothetical protein